MGTTTTPLTGSDQPQSQLNKYIQEIQDQQVQHADTMSYWSARRASWPFMGVAGTPCIGPIGSPASQAYIERVFSVCGMVSQGRRNRMSTSLKMRVRLKLNANV